jgi:hypothetical protein
MGIKKKMYNTQDFINQITPYFDENKFVLKKSLKIFDRKFDLGTHRFSFDTIYGIEIEIDSVGLKFNVIEDILKVVFDLNSSANYTIFHLMYKFLKKSDDNHFFVTTKKEMKKALSGTIDIFEEFAIPFYKKYSTLESLHQLINIESMEENINVKYSNNDLEIIFRGLIIARLLEVDNFESLKQKHTDYYKSNHNVIYHEKFDNYLYKLETVDFTKSINKIKNK